MDIVKEYSESIYKCLKQNLSFLDDRDFKRTGMLITRCPFCGDSRKHRNKGHFYICCKPSKEYPYLWCKCQRCGTFNILNKDNYVLELFNIFDDSNDVLRKEFNISLTKRFGSTIMRNNTIKKIKILPPLNNEYTKMKLKYINERLGIKLTQEKIEEYKIILNLKDFLNYNKIENLTCSKFKLDMLDKYYIGFLSTNNEFINFRAIDDKIIGYNDMKRYENYNIFGFKENTRRFITIKNKINIFKNIDIISAEGPFDIISIRENIYNCNDKNKLYVANMGMSVYSLMVYFMKRGLIFNNLKIFADKGVSLDFYRDVKRKLDYRYKSDNIEIYYNKFKNEKDFGVPKEKIKPELYLI